MSKKFSDMLGQEPETKVTLDVLDKQQSDEPFDAPPEPKKPVGAPAAETEALDHPDAAMLDGLLDKHDADAAAGAQQYSKQQGRAHAEHERLADRNDDLVGADVREEVEQVEQVHWEVEPAPSNNKSRLKVKAMAAAAAAVVAIVAVVSVARMSGGKGNVQSAQSVAQVANGGDAGGQAGQGGGVATAQFGNSAGERALMDSEVAITSNIDIEPSADMQPLPPAEQNCSSTMLSERDQSICKRLTAQVYFKCAPDGRRLDLTIKGCESVL